MSNEYRCPACGAFCKCYPRPDYKKWYCRNCDSYCQVSEMWARMLFDRCQCKDPPVRVTIENHYCERYFGRFRLEVCKRCGEKREWVLIDRFDPDGVGRYSADFKVKQIEQRNSWSV